MNTRTTVGVTLLFGTSLVITDDGNIAVRDHKTDTYIDVGPATSSTLDAVKYAAEHLKIHTK